MGRWEVCWRANGCERTRCRWQSGREMWRAEEGVEGTDGGVCGGVGVSMVRVCVCVV